MDNSTVITASLNLLFAGYDQMFLIISSMIKNIWIFFCYISVKKILIWLKDLNIH